MCNKFRVGHQTLSPGLHTIIHGHNFSDIKQWGIEQYYNARVESINAFWKNYTRIYIELSSFYEGRALFQVSDVNLIKVAGLTNEKGCVILTRPAVGIVKHYHHRMPIILSDADLFITTGIRIEIDYYRLRHVA